MWIVYVSVLIKIQLDAVVQYFIHRDIKHGEILKYTKQNGVTSNKIVTIYINERYLNYLGLAICMHI